MRSRLTEDSSSPERFIKESSYTLYVAFMAVLFALVSIHHKRDLKRLKFSVGVFVINFVGAWWALQHTTTVHDLCVIFRVVFNFTMILAPGILLHVLVLPGSPSNANDDDIAIDPHASVIEPQGEGTSSNSDPNTNINSVEIPLLVIERGPHVLVCEPQGEKSCGDPNPSINIEGDNNLSIMAIDPHVWMSKPQGEEASNNSEPTFVDAYSDFVSDYISEPEGEGTFSNFGFFSSSFLNFEYTSELVGEGTSSKFKSLHRSLSYPHLRLANSDPNADNNFGFFSSNFVYVSELVGEGTSSKFKFLHRSLSCPRLRLATDPHVSMSEPQGEEASSNSKPNADIASSKEVSKPQGDGTSNKFRSVHLHPPRASFKNFVRSGVSYLHPPIASSHNNAHNSRRLHGSCFHGFKYVSNRTSSKLKPADSPIAYSDPIDDYFGFFGSCSDTSKYMFKPIGEGTTYTNINDVENKMSKPLSEGAFSNPGPNINHINDVEKISLSHSYAFVTKPIREGTSKLRSSDWNPNLRKVRHRKNARKGHE